MDLETARNLKQGDVVSFDGNPELYEVSHVETTGPGRVMVLVDHIDHIEGLNTFFDERHLGIAKFGEVGNVSPEEVVLPGDKAEDEGAEESTAETGETTIALPDDGTEASAEELARQLFGGTK